MFLNFDYIKKVTFGIVEAEDLNGVVCFKRMSNAQISAYRNQNDDFYFKNAQTTASVRMSFGTDSSFICIDYITVGGIDKAFMGIDIYEDGVLTGHFTDSVGKEGRFTHFFKSGEKNVEIYLPWSCNLLLKQVEVQDGCKIIPVKRQHILYAFGDSITQGYDAQYPSLSYINVFSKKIGADVSNFAIGGDIYQTRLLNKTDLPAPDIITVASGTNDWNGLTMDYFTENCEAFYALLQIKYPNIPVYVITPVWRRDTEAARKIGVEFIEACARIKRICSKYENVTVIDGYNLVNRCLDFFSDGRLHPNDLGFTIYADRLYSEFVKLQK